MGKTVHIISHSHWDREWYMPFEKHRMKLIDLIDNSMELFEKDPDFKNFHLDGQTIVLDDYLEIKPENRERVEENIRQGRFHVGPWYILQDEFLTSGEANVRNLLVGMQEAKKYGGLCKIGYFPDAFGNAGQMPQLLKQAGMEAVVFGRGVKPVGFDNVALGGDYESMYSEMNWESPDGSSLLGILFANWYNNGMEIPVEPEAAKRFWDAGLKKAERFAGTNQLLFMNGCDHQPVQKDLSAAIETARKLYPDITFLHSDFETYVKAVKEELEGKLSCVKGELTSQETDGYWTLVNTTSSHVDLKMENRRCETALEKKAEPMAAMAALEGGKYLREFLRYSWKKLMQNHPHDSICGCSVDEVNREMKTRFDKSFQVAEEVYQESQSYLADLIDTESLPKAGKGRRIPFVVFNTSGWQRDGVVRVELELEKSNEQGLTPAYDREKTAPFGSFSVHNAKGELVDARIEDLGVAFGYTLPDDRFRQPYMARKAAVTLEAKEIPAFGYAVYYLEEEKTAASAMSLVTGKQAMENDFLRVEILEDGSYSLTEKKTGHRFDKIGWYEDTGDIGNEYIYIQNKNTSPITTKGLRAEIALVEDAPYRAVYEIRHQLEVPEGAEESFEEEKRRLSNIFERTAGRSGELVSLALTTRLTLEKSAKGLKVETTICNNAKDHRIRVMLPTRLQTETHFADSLFEVVERKNRHSVMWKNPSGCEHQQNFVAMCDEKAGILAANFGLYEYEVLPDEENTIAVTLLRAVSEMGDWGVFPTPDAQLQGTYTVSYEIVPFAPEDQMKAYQEAYQFQSGLTVCQTGIQKGKLPLTGGFFNWEGEGRNLTGFKQAEDGEDVIIRFVNNRREAVVLKWRKEAWFQKTYKSSVIEEKGEELSAKEQGYELTVRPFEIVTLRLSRQEGEDR